MTEVLDRINKIDKIDKIRGKAEGNEKNSS